MIERDVSPLPPSLSEAQVAFLVSLLPGPRHTNACHDAITVGSLLRLDLITWDDPGPLRQGGRSRETFALSAAGSHVLNDRIPSR